MLKTEGYVKTLGLEKDIGTKFIGKLGKPITITQSGLMAAAHWQGAGYVDKYQKFQNGSDWKSNFSTIRDTKLREKYESIETRLRLFQNTPYR
jgi:hypothetical protein